MQLCLNLSMYVQRKRALRSVFVQSVDLNSSSCLKSSLGSGVGTYRSVKTTCVSSDLIDLYFLVLWISDAVKNEAALIDVADWNALTKELFIVSGNFISGSFYCKDSISEKLWIRDEGE